MHVKRFLLLITGLALYDNLFAQLCQGSLGDPVVNITFGSGPNPGPPLPPTTTNYQYVTNACPVNGEYSIVSSGVNCDGYSWHTLPADHTGDLNGYCMLIDASFEPGDFYLTTVKGLCANTTYEFAAWILNMKYIPDGIKPNITFTIESTTGAILQSYTTGDVPAETVAQWRQYGFYFTTNAATTDIVLRMKNNAPGGDGNDLALDDITFRPCGPLVSVSINGSPDKKTVCTGDTSNLSFSSAIVGGFANPFYQWQKSFDGITWADIAGQNSTSYSIPSIKTPGKYFFRFAVAEGNNIFISSCRIASEPAVVTVDPLPLPAASNNGPVCEKAVLNLTANDGSMFQWTGPGNYTSSLQSPVIINTSLSNSGRYYVKVTSASGCINTDSTMVVINQNPQVDAGNNVSICEGTSITLQGSATNNVSRSWSPIVGLSDPSGLSPLASPDKTTLYTLTVNNGTCSNADSILINVLEKPSANAGPDKAVVGRQFATLEGQASGSNISYYWTPDQYLFPDSVLNPQASPTFDSPYTLHVLSNDGCGEAADEVLVKYYKEIYIPNAFTPDNNGLNDRWNIPELAAFPLAEVKVYNRFGELIFNNKGNTNQWDGTFKGIHQPPGVYAYVVDLKNGYKKLSGTLVLIR